MSSASLVLQRQVLAVAVEGAQNVVVVGGGLQSVVGELEALLQALQPSRSRLAPLVGLAAAAAQEK